MSLIEKAAAKLKKSESLIERAAKEIKTVPAEDVNKPTSVRQEAAKPVPEMPAKKEPAPVAKSSSTHVEINFDILHQKNILTDNDMENSVTAEEFRIVKRSLLLNAFSKGDAAIKNGKIGKVTRKQTDEGKRSREVSMGKRKEKESERKVK